MNDAKHTPGPWHFAYDGPSLPIVCTENEIIALVRTGRTSENTEIEANARLIAAAPDLLEALRDLVQAHTAQMGSSAVKLRVELAKAAIRKAEGK